jgi:hypothetical protein
MFSKDGMFETVELEKVRLSIRNTMSKQLLYDFRGDLELRQFTDQFLERMSYELCATLVGKKHVVDTVTVTASVEIPDGCWQTLRARWLPTFWLKRWPVRTRRVSKSETITRSVTRVCPHLEVPHTRGHHLQYLMTPVGDEERRAVRG